MKKEWILLVISIVSFLGYMVLSILSSKYPLNPLTVEFYSVILLLGILQFYIYTLVKILRRNLIGLQKFSLFSLVLITGHFGAWAYSLISYYLSHKAKVPDTDKIDMRVLRPDSGDREQKRSTG